MRTLVKWILVVSIVTGVAVVAPSAAGADTDWDSVVLLRNRATLHVTGNGWNPGETVVLHQEASIPGGFIFFRQQGQLTVVADSSGTWAADFVVVKRFKAPCAAGCGGTPGSTHQLNCVVHTCYVVASPRPNGGTRGFAFMWSDF